MNSLTEISNLLKNRRLALGLEISAVTREIKIRKDYIIALENGSFDFTLDEAYVIGYLKIYARYLGFDQEKLSNKYKELIQYKDLALNSFCATDKHTRPNNLFLISSILITIIFYCVFHLTDKHNKDVFYNQLVSNISSNHYEQQFLHRFILSANNK